MLPVSLNQNTFANRSSILSGFSRRTYARGRPRPNSRDTTDRWLQQQQQLSHRAPLSPFSHAATQSTRTHLSTPACHRLADHPPPHVSNRGSHLVRALAVLEHSWHTLRFGSMLRHTLLSQHADACLPQKCFCQGHLSTGRGRTEASTFLSRSSACSITERPRSTDNPQP